MAFPVIEQVTDYGSGVTGKKSYIRLPDTVVAGELLALVVISMDVAAMDPPAGWARKFSTSYSSYNTLSCFVRIAQVGDAGAKVTLVGEAGTSSRSSRLFRISGHQGSIFALQNSVVKNRLNATHNFNPVSPSWGGADNLYIAVAGVSDDLPTVNAYPAGYLGSSAFTDDNGINASSTIISAYLNSTASSETPGSLTLSETEAGQAVTLVIAPAGVDPGSAAPITLLEGNATEWVYLNDAYNDSGFSAVDSVDGDISESVVVIGTVDTSVVGVNTRTYDVDNSASVSADTVTRRVIVVERVTKAGLAFTDYSAGDPIIGGEFTPLWGTGYGASIVADTSPNGDQFARITPTSTGRASIGWDQSPVHRYGKAYYRWRVGNTTYDGDQQGPSVRVSGASGNETAFVVSYNVVAESVGIITYVNGTPRVLNNVPLPNATGEFINVLVDYSDEEVEVFAWVGDPDLDLPLNPQRADDGGPPLAGVVGINKFRDDYTSDLDFISMCSAIDEPHRSLSDISSGLTIPQNLGATPAQTSAELSWDPVDGATGYLIEYRRVV